MARTRKSTTTVFSSSSQEPTFGYEVCPIAPPTLLGDNGTTLSWGVGITCTNGDRIYWDEYSVTKICADDTHITWFKEPTFSDAVNSSTSGVYYRFYPNGSIETRYEMSKQYYYWSEEIDGIAEKGNVIWNEFNEHKQEYEEKEDLVPCKVCMGDCRGSNYQDWSCCSEDCCMIYYSREYDE